MRIFTDRQDDTSNSQTPNSRIESGWSVMTVTSGLVQYSKTITFQTAFVNKPVVVVTPGGDNTVNGGYGSGNNVISAQWWSKAIAISTTGFTIQLNAPSGSVTVNGFLWYQWIAIGQ